MPLQEQMGCLPAPAYRSACVGSVTYCHETPEAFTRERCETAKLTLRYILQLKTSVPRMSSWPGRCSASLIWSVPVARLTMHQFSSCRKGPWE